MRRSTRNQVAIGTLLLLLGGGAAKAAEIHVLAPTIVTMPLILEDHRVDLAGAIPSELHNYIVFTAGVGSAASQADGAKAFLALLTEPAALPPIKVNGFEPVTP